MEFINDYIFPQSKEEFTEFFPTEEKCRAYLSHLRWPNGFVCPGCQEIDSWLMNTGRHRCSNCKSKISITAHTMFHRTRMPLNLWFKIIWHITHQKGLANANYIEKNFELRTYGTSFKWLHKIRDAISQEMNLFLLSGEIGYWTQEIDIGDYRRDRINRRFTVAIVIEIVTRKRLSKIRMYHIKHQNERDEILETFMNNATTPKSNHKKFDHKGVDRNSHFGQLIHGYISQSSKHISDKYFQNYLDEITFRENYKGQPDLQFYLILKQMANPQTL